MVKVFDNDENRKDNFNLSDRLYFLWLALYMIMGCGVYFIIPFPLSLVASLAIFLLMNILLKAYVIKIMSKKHGYRDIDNKRKKNNGIKGFFNSLSALLYADMYGALGHRPLKFYCMGCGKEHTVRKCPNWGSMAVRAK